MPSESAAAPAGVTGVFSASRPAYTAPTAIPSGMLCSVTASVSIALRPSAQRGPSGQSLFRCRCGIRWSSSSKKPTPSQNPPAAGKNAHAPRAAAWSMAGISRLHTLAATITPAAKPVSARCTPSRRLRRSTNTQAAPSAVPAKGIISPNRTVPAIGIPPVLRISCN